MTEQLERQRLIVRCQQGEHNSEWSGHQSYSHRYFPNINFMITGRRNYNRLHCFNASDNAPDKWLLTPFGRKIIYDEIKKVSWAALEEQQKDGGCNERTGIKS